jgi:hypothetical protein
MSTTLYWEKKIDKSKSCYELKWIFAKCFLSGNDGSLSSRKETLTFNDLAVLKAIEVCNTDEKVRKTIKNMISILENDEEIEWWIGE